MGKEEGNHAGIYTGEWTPIKQHVVNACASHVASRVLASRL